LISLHILLLLLLLLLLKYNYILYLGLNRLIKINEDLYNSDKNDSQQIIDNKIECINKLQEELTDTKNTLMETEEKVI